VNSTKTVQDRIHTFQLILPKDKELATKIRNMVIDLKQWYILYFIYYRIYMIENESYIHF
jgi:hypothetical protein